MEPAVPPVPPPAPAPPVSVPTAADDDWSQPLPLHLADSAGEPGEPHILRGLD
ncbi:hypothetical protein [Streptomyces sp. Ru72]|uniref:hypothetical protein n=1 Tax=Streptomyces sp. Ru72 TaxID=2080747 RepID=UPI0015E31A84|nr:hypothetical protein [Streptomyces sp. Ru72]